jgi:hypothetical protein
MCVSIAKAAFFEEQASIFDRAGKFCVCTICDSNSLMNSDNDVRKLTFQNWTIKLLLDST